MEKITVDKKQFLELLKQLHLNSGVEDEILSILDDTTLYTNLGSDSAMKTVRESIRNFNIY